MASESDDDLRRPGDPGHPDHRPQQRSEPAYDDEPRQGRRSRLTVAMVAGAVLVAGGGGAYWAASASGDPQSGAATHADPPPLALTGWTDPGDGGTGTAPGPALKVTGSLPSGPATAPVYQAAGTVSRARVAQLAAALRVPGSLTSDKGLWRVAGGSASGPALQVAKDSPDGWSYLRQGAVCKPSTGTSSGTASGAGVCYGTALGASPAGGHPVSEAAAEHAAAPVLSALGLTGAAVDASATAGGVRTVTADPVVGGLPTHGWQTSLRIGPDGTLLSGAGRMVPLAKGTAYPVVSAERALQEMRQPGGSTPGQRLCGGGVMHPGLAGSGTSNSANSGQGAGTTGASSAPVRGNAPCLTAEPPVTVSGARFGLSAQSVNGRAALVPSWLFRTASTRSPSAVAPSAGELAQPAVDPKFLTAPSTPSAPATPAAHLTSYVADGRTVTLRFWGGVCANYSGRVVSQTGGAVRVGIASVLKDPGKKCPALAKTVSVKVTLDKPLDGRGVYDSADGDRVPAARS